jgi:phage pi2 protein 07
MADAPWVFLYQPDFVLAMRKNVHGYVYYSSDRFTRFKFISKTAQ